MSARVVTVGNAMADLVARVPHLPSRGGDVLASAGGIEVGGGGFRAIVAAAAQGVEAVYAGRIGTGPIGDLVRAELARRGIAAPLQPVVAEDTGWVVAMVEPDGERTFATVPGAESAEPGLAGFAIRPDDHVHVHSYGMVAPGRGEALRRFVEDLPRTAVVLLDPGPFGAGAPAGALERRTRRIDWWSGNGREAVDATGSPDPVAAARMLAATVRSGAVVRLGPDGCLLATGGAEPQHLPAPAVRALDTNGAGDTHVGVFLARLALGDDPASACTAANAAAAAFVSRPRP